MKVAIWRQSPTVIQEQAPVPERPFSANPGLKIFFIFYYLPSHALL